MKLVKRKPDTAQKVEVVVSNQTVFKLVAMVVVTILGLAALNKIAHALLILLVAFFLALALNAPVHWIAEHLPGKRRGSRSVATSISFFIVIAVLAGFVATVIPPTVRQVSSFISAVPEIVDDTRHEDNALGRFIRDNNLEGTVNNLSDELTNVVKGSGGTAVSTVGTVGNGIFTTIMVLALTFMMLVEGPRWVNLAKRFVPLERRDQAVRLTRDMYKVVRGFVNGQVTIAFIASIFVLPVMLILDIPYAGALAAIVFLCQLIPMIGAFIAGTIVSLVGLTVSLPTALLILAYYVLYQQIENYVLQPRIQANATNMSPLLVLSSVIIGVNLSGIVGGLLAIPVVGCLRIIVIDYLQAKGKLERAETKPKAKRVTAGAK